MACQECRHSASTVAVWADGSEQQPKAIALAAQLCLPLASGESDPADLLLTVTAARLELRSTDPSTGGAIYCDFVGGKNAFRRQHGGGLRQLLARAVGLRGHRSLTIMDATPGLGQDAFVLASLGGQVHMLERSPVVAALLADGLHRLASQPTTATALIHTAMTLSHADARHVLADPTNTQPDVVYLDPMYPHRDGSAMVKKEMRRLRILVGDDHDAPELLAMALLRARRRVVVKRPRLALPLAGLPPTLTMNGQSTRFDVYLIANHPGCRGNQ